MLQGLLHDSNGTLKVLLLMLFVLGQLLVEEGIETQASFPNRALPNLRRPSPISTALQQQGKPPSGLIPQVRRKSLAKGHLVAE
jgi:hypothetical protein